MIVPDSIQPYIGWKALNIVDGYLRSPQKCTVWPATEKLKATCLSSEHITRTESQASWVLEEGTPPVINLYTPGNFSSGFFNSTAPIEWFEDDVEDGIGIYYAGDSVNYPDPPDELPPKGYYWFWKADPKTRMVVKGKPIATKGCSCGIYAVDSAEACAHYASNTKAVLAEVALWGTVTVAHSGARGEFAYPQKLYIPKRLEREAQAVIERYEIPYEILPNHRFALKAGRLDDHTCHEHRVATRNFIFSIFALACLVSFCGVFLSMFVSKPAGAVCSVSAVMLIGFALCVQIVRR